MTPSLSSPHSPRPAAKAPDSAPRRSWRWLYSMRACLALVLVALLALPAEPASTRKGSANRSKSRSAQTVKKPASSSAKPPRAKTAARPRQSEQRVAPPSAADDEDVPAPALRSTRRAAAPRMVPGLEGWIASAERAERSAGEQWTVHVEDLASNRVVFEHNPHLRLVPASNRKLVPLALALETLGPDFTFSTRFGLSQKHPLGIAHFHGDLVMRSEGDPSLGFPFNGGPINPRTLFTVWAQQVRQVGIAYVHGALVIDGSAFGADQNAFPEQWPANHRNQAYAPIPSAITICQNLLRIQVRPGSGTGRTGRLTLYPSADGVGLVNATRTTSRGTAITATFDDASGNLIVSGPVDDGRGDEVLVPIERPLNYVGALMQAALEDAGVRLLGGVKVITREATSTTTPVIRMKLGEHQSPDLLRLLTIMMRQSNNFLAEQIWRAASVQATGAGDLAATRAFEQGWYARKGIPWVEPGWDGSGLSGNTKVSSADLVAICHVMFDSAWQAIMLDVLPESGRNGTLRNRSFEGSTGRVIAKTGTLNNASALTGFITDRAGNPRYVFSVIGNGPTESNRRLVGRINTLIEELIRKLDANSGALTAETAESRQGG